MSFSNLLKELFQNLNQQRLRSFLTIFGIMWGTATLILLLAFGVGFRDQTVLNMRGMGDQLAIMFPGQTTKPFQGYGIGRPIRYRESDAQMLKNNIPDIDVATPEYMSSMVIEYGEKRRNSSVGGVYPVYQELRNTFEQPGGRWLNQTDVDERRRVIFIGNRLAQNIFGEEDPVGKQVMVNNMPFTVIGVMQDKIQNSSYSQRDQDRSFIPAPTFSAITGTDIVNNILYTPKDPNLADGIQDQVYEVMGRKHRFDPADRDAIGIWDTNEFWSFINIMFLGINGFLGLIGFFTLAVGGIGVANIMFVVVQERMKEIGIRRAAGARRHHIMAQFFLETFAIIAIGASAGYAIGWLLVQATQNLPIKDFVGTPYFSPQVGIIAFAVLSLVGFAAGLLPAWRASRLDVVECLRK
ncbi:ABC transporter permease [Gracilimonas mengyeensis]|uniref:Putative ABC transport system permease protein n=1 Tax=Gracilimonas mengyeensis TaxID=1302730 RepID=A0A521EHV5_9BACT|nr:ABC transporter permease [Gracilimonas mengyeensis]SMO83514.1 putative ABC transport system permease protein [Gracilimonas mengyeensis]